MILSAVQQSESVLRVHPPSLFQVLFPRRSPRILGRVLCAGPRWPVTPYTSVCVHWYHMVFKVCASISVLQISSFVSFSYIPQMWHHLMFFFHCLQPLWKTIWRFFKKLKIELPYYPAIPLLGIYPEKNIIWKDTCTGVFTAALFIITETWKQPKCLPTEDWIKMWCIYTMEC